MSIACDFHGHNSECTGTVERCHWWFQTIGENSYEIGERYCDLCELARETVRDRMADSLSPTRHSECVRACLLWPNREVWHHKKCPLYEGSMSQKMESMEAVAYAKEPTP